MILFISACQVLLFNFSLRVANLNPLLFSFGEQGMQALLDLLSAVEGSVSEAAKVLG